MYRKGAVTQDSNIHEENDKFYSVPNGISTPATRNTTVRFRSSPPEFLSYRSYENSNISENYGIEQSNEFDHNATEDVDFQSNIGQDYYQNNVENSNKNYESNFDQTEQYSADQLNNGLFQKFKNRYTCNGNTSFPIPTAVYVENFARNLNSNFDNKINIKQRRCEMKIEYSVKMKYF